MTEDAAAVGLAAIIDALALVQTQLDRIERAHGRLDATQRHILERLDAIDAGQTSVVDLQPVLEMILARSIEDRDLAATRFGRLAHLTALAHAAASGQSGALPDALADDPLLEQFLLTQPADRVSGERAVVDWRRSAAGAGTAELLTILSAQSEPSPSDTAESRLLRYRLAAITRAELEGRGVNIPDPPASTIAADRSEAARRARSGELARLWRAGESVALYAEPELAGALDLFAAAERDGAHRGEKALSGDLAALHRDLGDQIASGERPIGKRADPRTSGVELLASERAKNR